MARQALFSIEVDGLDVSSRFTPLLISLIVQLDDTGSMDEATIELDDTAAQIGLPRKGAYVVIQLGWDDTGVAQVFAGFVDEVHWRFSRSTGRTLTIHAKSGDVTGNLKERTCNFKDDATLQDVANEWAQKVGLDGVKIDAALGGIKRPYWSMSAGYLSFMEKIADEVGGTFKVIGRTAVLVARKGGLSASGNALEPITATVGENLIDISAQPVLSRPEYGRFVTRFYDAVAAQWKEATSGDGSPTHFHQYKAPSQDQAQAQSDSNADESAREKGGAESVTIDGDPIAQPVAACTVKGARPGVDGIYTITKVVHSLTRSQGYTTRLELKNPSGDAGVDDRSAGEGDANETPVTTPAGSSGVGSA